MTKMLTVAPDNLNLAAPAQLELKGLYIKRPKITEYDWLKEEGCVCLLPSMLLEEAVALQRISEHYYQHPNLIEFHGCRVRRGRITGLILDEYKYNLFQYLEADGNTVDKARLL